VTAVVRSASTSGTRRLVLAWLAVAVPLAWGIGSAVRDAAALQLSNKLWLTLLPLLLGLGVCVAFYHLDRSRFTIRGVVGPYFSSVAILFALFASLLAAELWQRHTREDLLFHGELNGLQSLLQIAGGFDSGATTVRNAVRSYLDPAVPVAARPPDAAQPAGEPLERLYRLATDRQTFGGNTVANAAFLASLQAVRAARDDRIALHKERVSPSKFFTLLLFGLLTQVAIAFCHAGNPRALAASVMLFSIAFSAAIGILALLDDPYQALRTISPNLLNGV
jgi:hypothetical protein